MSAPVAFAADSPSPSASASTGTDGSLSAENQSTPSGKSTPSDEQSTPSDEQSTPSDEQSTPSDEQSTPSDEQSTPSDEQSTPSDEQSTPSDEQSTPSDNGEPPYCEELDGNFSENSLKVEVGALPGKITAGSGWHSFTLKVTNDSDVTLKNVAFYAEVESTKYWTSDKPVLSPYVDLEFLNPSTKSWESIKGQDGLAGDYFWGTEVMKPGDFNKINLRVDIHKDAPAGEAYHFGTGAYLDNINGKDCIAENWGDGWYFDILSAGTSNEDPGKAKPGAEKPASDTPKKPQGGVSDQPVTGSLAETGSSSAVPTIGLVGGLAVVVGAGALFVVRRRKGAGSDAAA
ncbi:LAETG motif-containing sortase-dependent surface protein [Streptomyces caeni]|uniref:LAETG motif-containing sortase-dependent surface protein n=1 Tax=Streptomyces caeni TaxID=2307231 RepID=A0ABW4IY19_9ACTN